MKRLDGLTQESAALKASIVPQLQALSNPVAELVNFGISVRCSVLFLENSFTDDDHGSTLSPYIII